VAVTKETLDILAGLRATLDQITDQQARELAQAWARGWQQVEADLARAVRELNANPQAMAEFQGLSAQGPGTLHPGIGKAREVRLLAQASEQAGQQLAALLEQAGVRLTADVQRLVSSVEGFEQAMVASQFPSYVSWNWTRVRPDHLAEIVRRTTEQITVPLYYLSDEATEAMKRALVAGMGQGNNPVTTARRMIELTEGTFNGGLRRAIVISRTEQLDAYRAVSLAARKANDDVLDGWQWVASLSTRTCASCLAKHGTTYPADEPGPLDHHQGRCTAAPVTKSWAELGFSGIDEPEPEIKSGDGVRWLEGQTEKVQDDILGRRGADMWRRGEWPPGDWSVRKSSDGWRDAWHAARPPRPPA